MTSLYNYDSRTNAQFFWSVSVCKIFNMGLCKFSPVSFVALTVNVDHALTICFCPFVSALAAGDPVSAMSHDVQRPISAQRSLRYSARKDITSKAWWRNARVWRLRQDDFWQELVEAAHGDCSRRRWRQDVWVRHLFTYLQSKSQFGSPYETST